MRMDENLKKFTGKISRVIPVIKWIPSYDRRWLKFDLVAGLTLAMFAIPDNMAYATLAGLPPEYGLYAGIMASIGYFIFASSRQAVVGPSSSEALMVGSFLGLLAIGSFTEYAALAALAALLVGVIAIIAWALRMGFLVNLISGPVLKGFLAGAGIVIIMSQVPKILGITGSPPDFFAKIIYVLQNLDQTNVYSLALGLAAIIGILAIEKKYPRIPGSLVIVIAAIIFMTFSSFVEKGVEVLGEIPQGLPQIGLPVVNPGDVATVFPLALALFILSYVELSTIARTYARKNRYQVDTNQELLALGASNVFAGIGQGFPVAGSFSKSAVNDRSRAKTPLAGAVAAGVTIIVVLFLTGFFYNLPECVIAALIIVAVVSMVNIPELFRIGHIDRTEFSIAIVTFAGVLVFGILIGVLIGTVLSLIDIMHKITFPHTAVIGRVPGTEIFGDIERKPPKDQIPGILIFRVDSPLLFANATTVREQLNDHIESRVPAVKLVILDFYSSPILDVTAADMINDLISDLSDRSIAIRLANTTGQVRDLLRKAGLEEKLGRLESTDTISTILDEWQAGLHTGR
jgi:sulfate permease, SulP family